MIPRHLAGLAGIGAALLPSVTCPACLPAYAAVLSSLGLSVILSGGYYYLTVGALLAISLVALGLRARQRRGYLPFWCGAFAAVLVLGNKWLAGPPTVSYLGAAILIAASVWNGWRHQKPVTIENQPGKFGCACDKPAGDGPI